MSCSIWASARLSFRLQCLHDAGMLGRFERFAFSVGSQCVDLGLQRFGNAELFTHLFAQRLRARLRFGFGVGQQTLLLSFEVGLQVVDERWLRDRYSGRRWRGR